jgi:hypothetical protein
MSSSLKNMGGAVTITHAYRQTLRELRQPKSEALRLAHLRLAL